MARNEPSLVPEWLRQGQGNSHQSQAHHRYQGDGGGLTTPRRYTGRDSEPSPWLSGSYVPPGRRNTGAERPSYDRSQSHSYFNRGNSSSRSKDDPQGGDQEKPSLNRQGGGDFRRGVDESSQNGGGEEASGPSLPTAMPTTTGTLASSVQKAAFERNFPVLGDRFGRFISSSSSVSSPRRSSSGVNGDGPEGWSSRLADLPSPAARGSSFGGGDVSGSPRASEGGARTPKMSEAVQQAMQEQHHRLAPQASLDSQKQEELALKKLKQLIPLKPSMPKNLLLKTSKRPSHSSTAQPAPLDAKHVARRSDDASGGARKPLSSLAPGMNGGVTNSRLLVPGSGLTLANAPATPPSPAGNGAAPGPKPGAASQKRNDFFKALRKKALSPKDRAPEGNGVAVEGGSEQGLSNNAVRRSVSPEAALDSRSSAAPNTFASPPHEAPSIPHSNGSLTKSPNGYANGATNGVMNGVTSSSRHNQDEIELVGEPEGEEAALLRSLGWTGSEDGDQEGALTEEEIRSFFSQTAKLNLQPKPSYHNGAQTFAASSPIHVASNARPGGPLKGEPIIGSYSSLSSGLSSSDDESDD